MGDGQQLFGGGYLSAEVSQGTGPCVSAQEASLGAPGLRPQAGGLCLHSLCGQGSAPAGVVMPTSEGVRGGGRNPAGVGVKVGRAGLGHKVRKADCLSCCLEEGHRTGQNWSADLQGPPRTWARAPTATACSLRICHIDSGCDL